MKRIIAMLSAMAIMAATMVVLAMPAFAQGSECGNFIPQLAQDRQVGQLVSSLAQQGNFGQELVAPDCNPTNY